MSVRCRRQLEGEALKKHSCGIWVRQKEAVGRRLGKALCEADTAQIQRREVNWRDKRPQRK